MKRLVITMLITLTACLLVATVVFAQEPIPAGQETTPPTEPAANSEVASLLLPLVAAATAIERIIEMLFDWFEGSIMSISKFPAQASDYVSWARKQVERYQQELLDAEADTTKLRAAEDNLLQAKDRLTAYLSTPPYTIYKRKFSLALGIALGLMIGYLARLQMFSLLGIPMPGNLAYVDILITGLVIGTGSAPVHSLIGIIQNTKDAIDGARSLWKGKATAEVKDLVKLVSDLQATQTPVAPLRAPAGAPASAAQPPAVAQMSEAEMQRLVERLLRK